LFKACLQRRLTMGFNLAFLLALLPAFTGLAAVQATGDFPEVQRVVIEHEVVIRVPVRPGPPQPVFDWVEHDGPKCIHQRYIAGALVSGPDHVDFVMRNNRRIRAKLGAHCPGLDFYSGFYLNPEDDKLCVGRDEIYSRVGGSCPIDEFRLLEPVRRPGR
jgi:hypothetical protein